jgi:hypothetical protein
MVAARAAAHKCPDVVKDGLQVFPAFIMPLRVTLKISP